MISTSWVYWKLYLLHYWFHGSCFVSFLSVHTSLIMFHLYFIQSTFHHIHFIYHSPSCSYLPGKVIPCLVVLILHGHSTLSFSFSANHALDINNLQVSLDKFLIFDRYLLLEAELWWFYYSLSFYIKQEKQQ